jgi:ketosteroid isomerase-like protein
MKTCPACNSQYTDDSLSYCLQDGTPLQGIEPDEPTRVVHRYGETDPSPYATSQLPSAVPGRERKVGWIIAVTVFGTIALLGVLGLIGYMLANRRAYKANVNVNTNASPTRNTAVVTPTPSPSPTVSPSPSPVDEARIRREVTQRVREWIAETENADIDKLMRFYADQLEYYTRKSASISAVRDDKIRAFSQYDSIAMDISDVSVQVSPDGNTATATFDKEWSFEGENPSSGVVRSQLVFKRVNGRWLIVSEKDLKVY